jgi:hypothetical protein
MKAELKMLLFVRRPLRIQAHMWLFYRICKYRSRVWDIRMTCDRYVSSHQKGGTGRSGVSGVTQGIEIWNINKGHSNQMIKPCLSPDWSSSPSISPIHCTTCLIIYLSFRKMLSTVIVDSKMPGVRCPTCAAAGQEVWVIPGRCCGICGTACVGE